MIKYHCKAVALAIHLVLWLCTRLQKWHQHLIALSRDLKYFDDVELIFPLDEFEVCSILYMFTGNKSKHWLHVANTEPGLVLVSFAYMLDPTNMELVKYFCLYFVSKNTSFGFCSCSKHLQRISVEEEKNFVRKPKLLSPQDRYGGG